MGGILLPPIRPLYVAFEARPGAKGSFDFADTSRYGPGHNIDTDGQNRRLIAGGGGGATTQRRTPGSIFGAAGTADKPGRLTTHGAIPHGVVIIRLTRIDP